MRVVGLEKEREGKEEGGGVEDFANRIFPSFALQADCMSPKHSGSTAGSGS